MLTTRQYLRNLEKETLQKLFKMSDLSEDEYWLLRYAFIDKRMVENTCAKLNISRAKYHIMLNQALIKVDYTIKYLDKVYTL